MRLRKDERLVLTRALQHFREGRLRPSEQAELREVLVRYDPRAATQDLPALIEGGRIVLGIEVLKELVYEVQA